VSLKLVVDTGNDMNVQELFAFQSGEERRPRVWIKGRIVTQKEWSPMPEFLRPAATSKHTERLKGHQ
jgi:hypothetical protein